MESKVNYIIVGIFVVLFSIGLASFAFWLEKYGLKEDTQYYKTFMRESISGLSKDSTVKYRGVDVGTVEDIRINPKNSEEVELLLSVKKETPIKENMVVKLKFYGLTGLAFIEIEGGSKESPLLKSKNGDIPIITSSTSIYTKLTESLPVIAQKLSSALGKVDLLLNDKNLKNISELIDNIKEISLYVKNFKHKISMILDKSLVLETNIISSSNKVARAADTVKQTAYDIGKSLNEGDYNLKALTSPAFDQANELLDELRTLAVELEEVVQSIQKSPSDLLFKRTKPKLGPGETSNHE